MWSAILEIGRRPRRLLALAAASAAGCGSPPPVFPALAEPPRWPPPPEAARIVYAGSLETDQDLKRKKGLGESLEQLVFGKKEARSMLSPYAVCTDGENRLFVCDSNAQVVHVFDLESRRYEEWRPDADQPPLSQPVGIGFVPTASGNRLLVSDSVAGTIHSFDEHGDWLGQFRVPGLSRPCGLAVDQRHGRIYVADSGAHKVLVLSIEGNLIGTVGERGSLPGQFNYPTNVAVDASGRLFVSDSLNFRVQVFDPELNPAGQIGQQGDMPGYFSQPKGVAVDGDGHVYVVDAHFETVQIFTPDGRLLLTFGEEGHGPGQFWLPAGVHIDSHNRIWVADTYNRRIQVFDYLTEASP